MTVVLVCMTVARIFLAGGLIRTNGHMVHCS